VSSRYQDCDLSSVSEPSSMMTDENTKPEIKVCTLKYELITKIKIWNKLICKFVYGQMTLIMVKLGAANLFVVKLINLENIRIWSE